jgi:hypothetical protein
MHRTDNSTSVATMPTRKPVGTWGYFTQGSESGGQLATIVEADILNAIMMEIANVVTNAGIALNKLDDTQLWQAINALIAAARLGFVPVEQGGGAGQGVNKVHIGWASAGSGLKVQVDATDLGPLAFLQQSQTWTQQQSFQGIDATLVSSSSDVRATGNFYTADGNLITDNGSVRAAIGRLTFGALGTGDGLRAVNLADFFGSYSATNRGYTRDPQGIYDQMDFGQAPFTASTTTTTTFNFPLAFPTGPDDIICSFVGNAPTTSIAISVVAVSRTQYSITINANSDAGSGAAGYTIRARGN